MLGLPPFVLEGEGEVFFPRIVVPSKHPRIRDRIIKLFIMFRGVGYLWEQYFPPKEFYLIFQERINRLLTESIIQMSKPTICYIIQLNLNKKRRNPLWKNLSR
jgi:hypothetical protein